MSLGQRIKAKRKEKKLTQVEVAKRLGIDNTTVSKWESDIYEPDAETLVKLAELFDTTSDYLLGLTNDPNPPDRKENKDSLPPLTPKDERDIAKDIERIMNNLESDDPMAFYGEPIDDQTKELLRMSLENSMRLAKQLAKKKFTPKKYRK